MKVCAACEARFNSVGWTCLVCYYQPKLIEGYLAFAPELAEEHYSFKAMFFFNLLESKPEIFGFVPATA